jgi:hypothetical protein
MKLAHHLLFLALATVCVFVGFSLADTTKADSTSKSTKATPTKPTSEDEVSDSATKSSSAGTRRDPFLVPSKVVRPPKPVKIVKKEPQPIPALSIEDRVTDYKKLMREFLEGRGSEPSKLAPYLIEELTVTGIFRNEGGYGAFIVEGATQKQQVFFARSGWQTHDGYIKEILPTGVKFIKKVRLDDGTVRQTEEFRALPAPSAK